MPEKPLDVGKARFESEKYIQPKQSANTLFRFFKKAEYLFTALREQALIPRYYGEDVRYLNIGFNEISYPMVCFCDINIHRLEEHISFYGEYGLAFSKPWSIQKGIQPIQYINPKSALCKDISAAFKEAMDRNSEEIDNPEKGSSMTENYLLTQMLFIKPINGQMPREGEICERNFTDEREWRYIPDVSNIDLPQVINEDDKAAVSKLNEILLLKQSKSCWVSFNYSDIKYIILSDNEELLTFYAFLDKILDDERVKRELISKVIIWSDAKEDF